MTTSTIERHGFISFALTRHLVRIAKQYETTPEELCRRLSAETGNRIGVVDLVIWRAANLRFI